MRASVCKDDTGYANWNQLRKQGKIQCFINGVEHCKVITADEEKRMALVYVLDEHGQVKLNADKTDTLRETVYGDVRIEIAP